ncbi:MAG: hypothetical protein ILP11_00730 [Alphaproteobacteria bacterium]|nr:hypothetical protein [Alphaproteobacteria bacterium]
MISKTQKGSIGHLLIILAVVALVTWGVMESSQMRHCVSQSGQCFKRSWNGDIADTVVDLLLCISESAGCVFEYFGDMLTSCVDKFF